jgi:hypothetical protein
VAVKILWRNRQYKIHLDEYYAYIFQLSKVKLADIILRWSFRQSDALQSECDLSLIRGRLHGAL